jgi:TonB-dependent Receptor Plug Domain
MIGCTFTSNAQNKISFTGEVIDKTTKEAIANASIIVNGVNYYTDFYGKFIAYVVSLDSVQIEVNQNNYNTFEGFYNIKKKEMLLITLIPIKNIAEIRITANSAKSKINSINIGLINIPMAQVKLIPSLGGEPDLLKAIQLLPGVQFGKEGSSNFYVRGGSQDQNLILLDEAPVYNPNHLFGFFSIFSPEAIKSFDLYKAGFPSKYGGRLSSILEIKLKEGNKQKRQTSLQYGLLSASLNTEGPIIKNKASYFLSLRTTLLDKLLWTYQNIANKNAKTNYGFYDAIFKTNYAINTNNSIYFSTYIGNDKFYNNINSISDNDTLLLNTKNNQNLQWGNFTSTLRWLNILNTKTINNLLLSYTNYKFSTNNSITGKLKSGSDTFNNRVYNNYESNISEISLKNNLSTSLSNHFLTYGIQFGLKIFSPKIENYKNVNNQISDTIITPNFSKFNLTSSVFFSDDWTINKSTLVQIGLRTNIFNSKNYSNWNLEPRLAIRKLISEQTSIKASYSRMSQGLHLLTSGTVGLPNDLWIPADKNLPIEFSNNYALGLYHYFADYEFSIEPYYKTMTNNIEYKNDVAYNNSFISYIDNLTIGKGKTYGIELFFKKNTGKLQYWLSYTLSKNLRIFSDLNNGNMFPYKYDRPHVINLFACYTIKENNIFSFTWQLSSGATYTIPDSKYSTPLSQFPDYFNGILGNSVVPASKDIFYASSKNNYRSRDFHRLDIAYNVTKTKKWGERTISFNIINLYGRQNTFYLYSKPAGYQNLNNTFQYIPFPKLYEVSLFSIIPSISVLYKLK